jgi:hypothetical protein
MSRAPTIPAKAISVSTTNKKEFTKAKKRLRLLQSGDDATVKEVGGSIERGGSMT